MPNTTDFSLPRVRLMELVAACPTFQDAVGETDAAGAMDHIHSPYADDHYDDAGELTDPRPRCIITWGDEWSRKKLGNCFGGSTGSLIVCFEFLPLQEIHIITPPNTTELRVSQDQQARLEYFEEQIGNILHEMENRESRDKGAGEDVFTDMDTTHLNVTGFQLLGGPAECYEQEEGGKLFMGVMILVEYVG